MVAAATIHKLLFGVGLVLSLLVWTIAAGLVAAYDNGLVYGGTFDAANAVLAWGLISWLYYIAALVIVLWVSTTNVFIWILVDIPIMFFLWLFGIASTGCLSDVAHWFRALASNGYSSGSLGQATLAFAWILVFLQLGNLIWEAVYVWRNGGTSVALWKQSFNDFNATGGGGTGGKTEVSAVQTA